MEVEILSLGNDVVKDNDNFVSSTNNVAVFFFLSFVVFICLTSTTMAVEYLMLCVVENPTSGVP